MNETFKKVLIAIGIPLAIMLMFLAVPDGAILVGVLALLVPFVYLIAGIIMLFTTRKKLGQVLLISGGIIFLIGFSVCSIMLSNMNFH
ncbi:MAG TPA: hypothetical protein VGD35_07110 [Chitinophaga sp.]